ncbi:MAG: glucose-1-phosphate thymidylyltransferase RfbA [Elusimicrobia bacterium]|nr:glucose-1-phosphate thymidylyltransferase RfbA [Elusimicrobiota bacterium]
MNLTKGIILAGGKATRLYPVTKAVSKQLLPIYNKPMIYYPLSILMLAGIKDILIISTSESIPQFNNLLGDGKNYGLSISYAVQEEPNGIAEAFIIGEKFIGNNNVSLILGDNIFFGGGLSKYLKYAIAQKEGATIFGFYVNDPQRYGIISLDKNNKPVSIEEKPKTPKSNWAVTGLYFYDNKVVEIAKKIKPSNRGELEITDINIEYLKHKKLNVVLLGRGNAWLDTGTYDSLIDASMFIKTIEERQGLKVGSIEEISFRMGYITKEQLKKLGKNINTSYGDYLCRIADEK